MAVPCVIGGGVDAVGVNTASDETLPVPLLLLAVEPFESTERVELGVAAVAAATALSAAAVSLSVAGALLTVDDEEADDANRRL